MKGIEEVIGLKYHSEMRKNKGEAKGKEEYLPHGGGVDQRKKGRKGKVEEGRQGGRRGGRKEGLKTSVRRNTEKGGKN